MWLKWNGWRNKNKGKDDREFKKPIYIDKTITAFELTGSILICIQHNRLVYNCEILRYTWMAIDIAMTMTMKTVMSSMYRNVIRSIEEKLILSVLSILVSLAILILFLLLFLILILVFVVSLLLIADSTQLHIQFPIFFTFKRFLSRSWKVFCRFSYRFFIGHSFIQSVGACVLNSDNETVNFRFCRLKISYFW